MAWMSQEIEEISGYPVTDFIDSSERTFASVIHPDDREQVERSVTEAVNARRPFSLEYRINRRDGEERWVLERGQAQESGDGRRWLDGAIFDITVRRAAEQALREREVVDAQLAEVRASRARILDTADQPAARSSATSTMARNNGSCRWHWNCSGAWRPSASCPMTRVGSSRAC